MPDGLPRFDPDVRRGGEGGHRSIAQLEDHLGITVLSRTTRSVRVTERGRIYLERCEQILGDVNSAERLARGEDAELRGELTIAAPVMFGRLHVLPVVSALLAAHRGLAIRLGSRIAMPISSTTASILRSGSASSPTAPRLRSSWRP